MNWPATQFNIITLIKQRRGRAIHGGRGNYFRVSVSPGEVIPPGEPSQMPNEQNVQECDATDDAMKNLSPAQKKKKNYRSSCVGQIIN